MINLVRQYNLTSIQKHLDNCIKRKEKRDRIMAQIEAIFKKEAIYIGHDKVKEVRVVIGRQLAYSRCCPDDTFDVSREVAMCICDILNKKTEMKEFNNHLNGLAKSISKAWNKKLSGNDLIRLHANGIAKDFATEGLING